MVIGCYRGEKNRVKDIELEKARWKEGVLLYTIDSKNITHLLTLERRHGERNRDSPGLLEGMIPSSGDAKAHHKVQVAILVSLRDSPR